MIGVILAILHIMIAIYVAFRVLKQLYYMFENIKEKDMRSAAFNVLVFAILAVLLLLFCLGRCERSFR